MNIVHCFSPPSGLHSARKLPSFATPLSPSVECRSSAVLAGSDDTPVVPCCVLVYTSDAGPDGASTPSSRSVADARVSPTRPRRRTMRRAFSRKGIRVCVGFCVKWII